MTQYQNVFFILKIIINQLIRTFNNYRFRIDYILLIDIITYMNNLYLIVKIIVDVPKTFYFQSLRIYKI